MMWDYDNHMSGWGWAFMGVGMVLFWAVVITALVILVRFVNQSPRRESQPPPAEILARRFARGEIDEDEFLSKTNLLKR